MKGRGQEGLCFKKQEALMCFLLIPWGSLGMIQLKISHDQTDDVVINRHVVM